MAETLDASVFESELVQILVGPERQAFHVHKDILCLRSPFFQKCLDSQSGFEEALRNSVNLPEDDPTAFTQAVKWIYTGEVTAAPLFTQSSMSQEQRDEFKTTVGLLIDTYILANKYYMEELENKIVDVLLCWHSVRQTSLYFVERIVEGGPPSCQLSDYLRAQSAFALRRAARDPIEIDHVADEMRTILTEGRPWLSDLFILALRLDDRSVEPSRAEDDCRWHSHILTTPGDPCKCKRFRITQW